MSRRQNIQPVDGTLTGTDLTTALNDRIRRINQALTTTTPVAAAAVAPPSGSGNFAYETPAGTLGGTVFSLSHTPAPANSLVLRLNGVIQLIGIDITVSGSTITYAKNTDPNDWHFAGYSF